MTSKLKIFCAIFTFIFAFVLIGFQFSSQKNFFDSIFNAKTFESPDCCRVVTTCCDESNSEVKKCLNCNVNEKQATLARQLSLKMLKENPHKLIAVGNVQVVLNCHYSEVVYYTLQYCIVKNYQLGRPRSYPYLENIRSILLIV